MGIARRMIKDEKKRFIIGLALDIVLIITFAYFSMQATYWWKMGVHDGLAGCPALMWGNRSVEEVEQMILNSGMNNTINATWWLYNNTQTVK